MKKYCNPDAIVIELSSKDDILNGSGNIPAGDISDILDTTGQLDIVDFVEW